MSTYLEPRRVRISSSPDEPAVIEIDGHDVASAVEAYRITQARDEGPEVTLYVAEGWKGVEFDGMAEVAAEPADLRHVVVGFLQAVDWRKLDAAVLDRADLDGKPGELTRGALAQLVEWAQGA
ncbi:MULTISPECIES: hypothetical protein [unclassified Streptomyces]|uniref:hypothetical protein n=1 Tax=unclassified Streptomyces TaxID=2593676 RepID=UPI00380C7E92